MAKPSLVFLHGSWHSPAHYQYLEGYLEAVGYKCIQVAWPSIHPEQYGGYPKDWREEIKPARAAILHELDSGNNVTIIAHSFAGIGGLSSIVDLDTNERSAEGKTTSVISAAFIAAFIVPEPTVLVEMIGGNAPPIHVIEGDFCHGTGGSGPIYSFYNDLDPEEAKKWSSILRPQYWPIYKQPTLQGEVRVPVYYLLTKNDNALPLVFQQHLVDQGRAAGMTIETESCDTGHSPFLNRPEETAVFVRRAAGEDIPSLFSK